MVNSSKVLFTVKIHNTLNQKVSVIYRGKKMCAEVYTGFLICSCFQYYRKHINPFYLFMFVLLDTTSVTIETQNFKRHPLCEADWGRVAHGEKPGLAFNILLSVNIV